MGFYTLLTQDNNKVVEFNLNRARVTFHVITVAALAVWIFLLLGPDDLVNQALDDLPIVRTILLIYIPSMIIFLFFLLYPLKASLIINLSKGQIILDKTKSFFRKEHLEISLKENPVIYAERRRAGGGGVIIHSRIYMPKIRFTKNNDLQSIQILPKIMYYLSVVYTVRFLKEEIKEIAKFLGIKIEIE